MKKYRKFNLIFMMFVVLALLTGCKTKYSSIPSESEVMEAVAEVCPSEAFSLVSKDQTGTEPDEETYSFTTDDRGLEFTAVSTLDNRQDLGEDNPYVYEEKITVDYADAVKALYLENVINIFKDIDYCSNSDNAYCQLDVEDDSHTEEIADAICQAQEIYAAELQYNTQDWLVDNPIYKRLR